MKQYTTPEQTAKLIVLGFEKPKSRPEEEVEEILKVIVPFGEFKIPISNNCPAYSIGELIEILPKTINLEIWWGKEKGEIGTWGLRIDTDGVEYMWTITYERDHSANLGVVGAGEELIDALYDMILQLKEEGVI